MKQCIGILLLAASGIAQAASSNHFHSGVGISLNLGPGTTLVNKNVGAFHSGNFSSVNNNTVPGPALAASASNVSSGTYGTYSGAFGVPWINASQENQNPEQVDNPVSAPIPVHHDPTAIIGATFAGTIDTVGRGWRNGYPLCYNGAGVVNVSYDNGDVAAIPCVMTGYVNDTTNPSHLSSFFLGANNGVTNNLNSYFLSLKNTTNTSLDLDPNPIAGSPDALSGSVDALDTVWSGGNTTTFNNVTGSVILTPSSLESELVAAVGSSASAATPSTQIIDFSQGANVKNRTGLAYMFGVNSQYVSEKGLMLGISVNYGRTGSSSNVDYNSGSLTGTQFQQNDPVSFSIKDQGYVSELIQIGYAYKRINPYFIFGLAQHKAKMWCPDAYNNASNGISKSYNTPVFGLGLNIAVMKNTYISLQWQRHVGGVKNWSQIDQVLPQGRVAMGAPQTRFGNTMILFGVTYLTNFSGQ